MPKQFIHLLGAVVVIAVIVAGTLLIGAPLLSQSFSTSAQTTNVDSTNLALSTQVTTLQKEKKDFDSLSTEVASLRAQIPSTNKQDDVFLLVANAATATGVVVTSVTAAPPIEWIPRVAPTLDGLPATGAAAAGSDSGAAASGSAPAPEPSPSPTAAAASNGSPAPATPPASTKSQVPFTIVVSMTEPSAAAAFIDALGAGPRVLGIIHSVLDDDDTGYKLTIDALAYVNGEN